MARESTHPSAAPLARTPTPHRAHRRHRYRKEHRSSYPLGQPWSAGFGRSVHKLLAHGTAATQAMLECYGPQVQTPDGGLDRRSLGRIIFARPAERRWLEVLTHPPRGRHRH